MTRPDDEWHKRMQAIPADDFAKAAEVVKANFNLSKIVNPDAYATIIAEAIIAARAEQREEDRRLVRNALFALGPGKRTNGDLCDDAITNAIRNGVASTVSFPPLDQEGL